MAFDVILQKNLSEKILVNKNVVDIATKTGVLKEGTTIVNPSILIEGDFTSELSEANYMTIPTFGRSYYIGEPFLYRANLIQYDGHCDVLSSFKSTLLTQKAIIRKQSRYYNLLLNDGSIHAYQNPYVLTFPFPNSFTDANYVLIVAGAAEATQIIIVTQPTNASVANVGDTASFTVVATGDGLTYQWQVAVKNGFRIWGNVTGETNSTYSFVTQAGDDEWVWRCKITNSYGASAYTNPVEVRFS